MYIDIGVNLTNQRFANDLDAILQRANQAQVEHMLVLGTHLQSSQAALQLAQLHPGQLSATAGFHPHHASEWDSESESSLTRLLESEQVRAIGECGLDFNRNFSPPQKQLDVFEKQLTLASKLQKPLFLHQRDAHDEFLEMLDPFIDKIPAACVHCFTEGKQPLDDYLDRGFAIGVTGWICDERRGLDLQKIVSRIPQGLLMIETDAPYLTPRDLRPKPKGGRNEPMFLPHIAQSVAQHRNESVQQLAQHTTATAKQFFGL